MDVYYYRDSFTGVWYLIFEYSDNETLTRCMIPRYRADGSLYVT